MSAIQEILRAPLVAEPTQFLVLVIPLSAENMLRLFTDQKPLREKRWIGVFELGLMRGPVVILEER